MIKKLIELDRSLFLKINRGCQNDFFDTFALLFREPKFWVPFYLFILVFAGLNFGKKAWVWILYAGLTVAAADTISSKILKGLFGRPRPCADVFFQPKYACWLPTAEPTAVPFFPCRQSFCHGCFLLYEF